MFSPAYLCICLFCMAVLAFLFVMENRRRSSKTGHEKYFLVMLVIAFLSFVADIMSSLYLGPAWFFPFAVSGNYIEILLNTTLIPIYFRFICDQVRDLNLALCKRLCRILWAMSALIAGMAVLNLFTGVFFYFDSARVYHRGEYFMAPMAVMLVMMGIVEVFLLSQRKKIEAKYFKSLAFFLIAPLIGWALQCLIFGLPFSLLGITFAALVLFTDIQSRNMDKDYLTGAFNRQTLDSYLQQKIDGATPQRTFAAILLDIDEFKVINDNFGHYEGDMALINTVKLLRESVAPADFIARYGGDEFCVILENGSPKAVASSVRRIEETLARYNESQNKPYTLGFSMGCAIYDPAQGARADTFYRVIDKKMYRTKRAHKSAAVRAG